MPRAKKTMAGTPGQKIQAISGQTYGEGVRQEELQRTMPAPQTPGPTTATRPIPAAPTAQAEAAVPSEQSAPMPQPRMSLQEAMQRIQGTGGILRAADDNPNLPVTDGLPTGPGRGPEALMANSHLGNTLRRLATQTGDPIFRELASKVRF